MSTATDRKRLDGASNPFDAGTRAAQAWEAYDAARAAFRAHEQQLAHTREALAAAAREARLASRIGAPGYAAAGREASQCAEALEPEVAELRERGRVLATAQRRALERLQAITR